MPNDVVLIFSGGLDSTSLMWKLLREGGNVHALSFNYGQKHSRELHHAGLIARMAAEQFGASMAAWRILDVRSIGEVFAGSSQTEADIAVPEGHYAAESMKKTVVPNRNMVMLAIAGAYAVSIKADALYYGAHAGDHAIYPDCRLPFVNAMQRAFLECDWHGVSLFAPFLMERKEVIARVGYNAGAPLHLTWSCYNAGDVHCGKCGTCVERIEAFSKAGLEDPTVYAL